MIVNVLLNGINISTYGITLLDGSLNSAMEYPPMKTVKFNNWQELNGIEPDLSNPKVDSKNFTMNFSAQSESEMNNFLNIVNSRVEKRWRFVEFGIQFSFRMIGITNYRNVDGLCYFTLSFTNDKTFRLIYGRKYINNTINQDWAIDGLQMKYWGIFVREGTLSNLQKRPDLKENLLIKTNVINGSVYDYGISRYKQVTTDLFLNIRLPVSQCWNSYIDFFNTLTNPDLRVLTSSYLINPIPFYYNSNSIQTFTVVNSEVWCDFTVNITIPVHPDFNN